ncbi:MAG: GGDEF domain-containing protein [Clostridia bacterium]|nr:GGDEF domain-containing protein [Clostridia bacterium]
MEKTEEGAKKKFSFYKTEKGIPLKTMTLVMAAVTVIVSLLLIICVIFNFRYYRELRKVSEEYVKWENAALDMQKASDYLTEEARTFADTGDRTFLDNYFREAKETRRRENAIALTGELFLETQVLKRLNDAMKDSVDLMNVEYYSMRLRVEADGADPASFPEELQNVALSQEDLALSADQMSSKSQELLFDKAYRDARSKITTNTDDCLEELSAELKSRQDYYSDKLNLTLIFSLVFILLSIAFALIVYVLTHKQVFKPLITSIPRIEADSPIPVEGAYEFRVLAKTYNVMREANARSKNSLRFKANHDALTGVLNRRGFSSLADNIISDEIALLIIDVDNFKYINDTYGHLVGDSILVNLVGIIKENFRADDRICRMGGDEFVVVMLFTNRNSEETIKKKVDQINEALKAISGELPPSTISVGVAFGTELTEELYKKADRALYVTKNSGKCGCTFAE